MGLDVYKLKIVRNYPGELTADAIYDNSNLKLVIKSDFEEYLETRNNKRLNELFTKFQDGVKKVLVKYYDLDHYSEKLGVKIDQVEHIFPSQIPQYVKMHGFTELDGKYQTLADYRMIALLMDVDGKLIHHTAKELKTADVYLDALIFEVRGYQRSCDLPALYDKFYGDCWYKKDNTGIKPEDQRWFVFGSELDELKKCFVPDCDIQEWDLYSSEVIYLNP